MPASKENQSREPPLEEFTEASGPWPFVTRRVFRAADQTKLVWCSRDHRKRLSLPGDPEANRRNTKWLSCLWMPEKLNWWIGTIFALGSFLFALASVLSLSPALAKAWALNANQINAIFFAGSIPFTTAGYLQLFQAANVGDVPGTDARSSSRTKILGWRPHDIGWLSAALQFAGTILFNINTFDAMLPSLNWFNRIW
jgi:hypothetical protein